MEKNRILAVEDEEDLLELIRFNLSKDGFKVTPVLTGEEALKEVRTLSHDLVLLDIMLPGISGFEVAKRLKEDAATASIPIVMVTAKTQERDIVAGLEMGADDYITKPFSPKVLSARVKAVLRRIPKTAPLDGDSVIAVRDLVINPGRHEVLVKGKQVKLTFTEFSLLSVLARRPGWVFTRAQLIDAIRGKEYAVTDRSVDVQVVGLRKSLGSVGKMIETVRGVGYRFQE